MTKITIDRATVEQALEALKKAHPYSNSNKDLDGHSEAITALRQALEQPNEFHPDWDQLKPFNDRIAELESVAKQALEALENASDIMDSWAQKRQDDSIAALRERLGDKT